MFYLLRGWTFKGRQLYWTGESWTLDINAGMSYNNGERLQGVDVQRAQDTLFQDKHPVSAVSFVGYRRFPTTRRLR